VGSLSLVPHPFKGSFIFRVVQHYDENTARNPVISTRALAREKGKGLRRGCPSRASGSDVRKNESRRAGASFSFRDLYWAEELVGE